MLDSRSYRVALKLDERESVTGGGCSCPKVAGGGGCEHIAAVCLAVEARLERDAPRQQEPVPPWPRSSPGAGSGKDFRVTVPFRRTAESGEYHYFDLNHITKSITVMASVCREGWEILKAGGVDPSGRPHFVYPYEPFGDELVGRVEATVGEDSEMYVTNLHFSKDEIQLLRCSCGARIGADPMELYDTDTPEEICVHGMALLYWMEDYILRYNPGDATDVLATRMLGAVGKNRGPASAGQKDGRKTLRLVPRLEAEDRALAVSFWIGTGKLYMLKDLPGFVRQFENGEKASFGRSAVIDYSACEMDEESERYFRFIRDTVVSEYCRDARWNSALHNSAGGLSMTIKDSILLTGGYLDTFYELIRDRQVEFVPKGDLAKYTRGGILACRDARADARFTVEKRLGGEGRFEGVTVSCRFQPFAEGLDACYRMTKDNYLERVPKDSIKKILPLCREINAFGILQFHVGRGHLSRFYRDMLPVLRESGTVSEPDADYIAPHIPPEPVFRFYLDADNGRLSCRVTAAYGETEADPADCLRVKKAGPVPYWRDRDLEKEILDRASEYFPEYDEQGRFFYCRGEEKTVFLVLSQGVPELMGLGEVNCTQQFLRLKIRPVPKITIGMSLESGLLDLSISSGDLSREELLDILDGYRRKKQYIRLKNGDFFRTDCEEESLEALEELLDALRISPKEFVAGKMQIPAYRALYLDRMLEERTGIAADRDSRFRELVEGFKAVSDSDFRVPESLAPVLRGYQTEGYKWLRTLEAYNFGGILADDMGLGKTLQMISVFLTWKEEGKQEPSLVVCPASLVYNWGEELERFAPRLRVALVAGTRKEREKLLASYDQYDVLVTSYDLLKRDIDKYEDITFLGHVLDEAQNIKNHTTAAAKSVKLIKSKHRYALTGTPIENRLSELWSIFDFLMPGFLYSYDVFRQEIEIPVVKRDDKNASGRLRRMVSPFILRRLKKDVLKDLPDKIEEVVYARADKKQQLLCDGQAARIRDLLEQADGEDFSKDRIKALAELTRLREICCDPSLLFEDYDGGSAKREACLELVGQAMEGGHRMLIFSQFTSMLALLEEDLRKAGIAYYKIIGATPKEQRVELVREFNEGETPVFLISLKAGGTGLNLTGADIVIHYDPWWNMAAEDQATDRAHRIGQTRVVTEYKLILKDSVEEKILRMQEEKSDLADEILSGEEPGSLGSMSREDLLALLGV